MSLRGGSRPKSAAEHKSILKVAILVVALLQLPQMALTPGIARMHTDAFPEFSLLTIQAAVTLPCLVSVLSGIIAAMLIRFGVLTKKSAVLVGLLFYGMGGLFTVFFHAEFWQVIVAGLLLGWGTGMFISNITSIMIDSFTPAEVKVMSGLQVSFVSLGGFIMSFFAGLLVTVIWYGGYILLMLALPICVFCLLVLPKEKPILYGPAGRMREVPYDVVYYSVVASFLFVLTYASLANNLSSHFQAIGIENYSAAAGIGISINLAGSCIMGFFFQRLSGKFGDYLIAAGFITLALGLLMVSVFTRSIPLMYVGTFISGTSLCLATPQGIVSFSRYTTPNTSFFASMFFASICNGVAGFASAPVYTGLSQMIAGDNTVFRYQFIAICSLVIGVIFALTVVRRAKRGKVWR